LPEPELSFQEADRLIMQQVLQPLAIEFCFSKDESPLGDFAETTLAVGQNVKPLIENGKEKAW